MEIWHSNICLKAPPIPNMLLLWGKKRSLEGKNKVGYGIISILTPTQLYLPLNVKNVTIECLHHMYSCCQLT